MRKFLPLLLVLYSFVAGAQSGTEALRQKSLTLRRFLEQNHYQPLRWDDSASTRLYDRWMEVLDDDKLIFSKTETEQLAPYRIRLDEEMMGREWNFFNKSMLLYKSGLQRADSIIKNILAKPLDFAVADNLKWPLADYTANGAEIYQTWQKYLKWKVLRSVSDMLMDSDNAKLNELQQPVKFAGFEIKARENVKKQELLWVQNKLSALAPSGKEPEDNYLAAISWCYDPHTTYMNADTKTDFETELSGLEFSTGFEMDENEKGEWVISYLVPGGPAWRNGELHKGDVILKIRSGEKPELALADVTKEQLGRIFEGSSSEKITITVRTVGGAQKTAVLTKEKVTNEEGVVKSYVLNGAKKIGYITLPGFYVKEGDEDNMNGCSNDVAKEVVKLKKDSIAGLILDLRFNGGGSLFEALELAGIFINEGSLTSTRDKAGKVRFLKDPNRGTIYDGPLLVMVNTLSASASELVTAVLQDYHRALVVGSPTYGKGSAQVILPMDTTGDFSKTTKFNSYVKVTHAKFYRVDGSTTQWKGVIPDIELPDMYAMDRLREKGTVSALKPDNSKTAIYQPLPAIPFAELKSNSSARVSNSKDFTAISTFLAWYKSMDGVRNIPLQWTGYYAYYKKVTDMYRSIESDINKVNNMLVATNNSLDGQRTQFISEQSKNVNEVNIKRIEKDSYVAESYRIMQDWLR
ncbi:MAG: carboxy terminal-processing peptidase [Ferruginibacter sp.]